MKHIERIREGRKARLRAEVNFALNNTPINCVCVYKRIEQRNQYMRGWKSPTALDIQIAIARARGELVQGHQQVQLTMSQLKEQTGI